MRRMTLRLHPADVLMFRETRFFGTGAGASDSVFPVPRTVAGAVWAYLLAAAGVGAADVRAASAAARSKGCHYESDYLNALKSELSKVAAWPVDAHLAGPFLSKRQDRWFPLPRHVVKVSQQGSRDWAVAVLKPNGICAGVPLLTPRLANGQRPAGGSRWEPFDDGIYIRQNVLEACMDATGVPSRDDVREGSKVEFIDDEVRVGVGLQPDTLTSEDGLLYSSTFARLKPGVALEVDIELSEDDAGNTLTTHVNRQPWLRLGGDARLAWVELLAEPWSPPAAPASTRALLYLATPALFTDGGTARGQWGYTAAAVGKPLCFSGWNLAAQLPMQTRYAVPAGAVYFLNAAPSPDPHGTCISEDPDDCAAGWGYCLRGVW